jgi:ribonuclease HI
MFNEEKSKVMLITRRKRREDRTLNIYLNYKKLEQVTTLKYLGIIIDHKFTFKEHIAYATDRCTKLIQGLSRAAKVTWGIKHEAMKTIYKGAILPLLLYGAPVWIEALKYAYNKRKYIRVQRLINIRTAKAYRTTSNEALCILTGTTPIIIKADEAVKLYSARKIRENQTNEIDYVVEYKNWPHPADGAITTEKEETKDSTVRVYTDGSKSELGVGSGVVIYINNEIETKIKSRLDSKCSNNQAEQFAIINALEAVTTLKVPKNLPRTATIYTDSKITLYSLQNPRNHTYLIDEIRKKIAYLKEANWKIKVTWIKAHAGNPGNEMADKLAKEAARSSQIDITFSKITLSLIYHDIQKDSIKRWQKEWQNCTKALTTK